MRNTRSIIISFVNTRILLKYSMAKNSNTKNNMIIAECIELLKRDDLKYQLKMFLEPIITMIFNILNPYIYVLLGITIIILTLLIAILIIVIINMRNNITN
jgi:hypothetical protein